MPFNAEEFVAQLRQFVWRMRRGRREVAAATIAALLFGAGTWLLNLSNLPVILTGFSSYMAYSLYLTGGLLLVWAGYRIWQQAVPPPLPSPEPRPAAVKGPMSFGPEDGALFQLLGREHELAHLLGLILNDQIPLVMVMGESGVGKTSILRAGLTHILKDQHVQYLYWEAIPTQSPERLLHAIQEQWQSSPMPQGWDDILQVSSQGALRRVIVLDQFEQLHPDDAAHRPIFDLLRWVATLQMPPYQTTWIVAFRREYDPLWRDFELTIPDFHPPMLSMRLFGEEPAKEILATLAEAAHLTLDQALVTDLVKAAARDGRVAAVDLGIGLLVLSELASRKATPHLRLDDYRFAGGSAGLLTDYLRDRFDRFRDAEREAVLKALLALTNRDTQQRLAEGLSLDALAQEAAWPQPRLQSCLDYLAAPHVRLLEKAPGGPGHLPSYRLPHERLVPSLHQLTGVIFAAVEQTRMTFDAAFRAWINNGQRRRYLLDGTTLKQLHKHLVHMPLGEKREAKTLFLERSIQKRRRMRWAEAMLGVLTVGIIMISWWGYTQQSHKDHLSAWGLPRDLYTYQHQLKALSINAPITHLRWLKADLIILAINGATLQELTTLPRTLIELDLSGTRITSLAGLAKLPQLTTLRVRNTAVSTLPPLPPLPQLTTLDLSHTPFYNLAGLPPLPQLTTLDLSNTRITSLAGLEQVPQLTTLDLSNTRITSVEILGLCRRLKTLRLPKVASLNGLPTSVTELVLE
jgi:hypothetical protein